MKLDRIKNEQGRPSVGRPRLIRRSDPHFPTNLPSHLGFPRSECAGGPRPCPLVSCKFNTYLHIRRDGTIVIPHGSRAPEDVPPDESCVLDLVDEGLQTLDRIGQIFGLTRERIRQIELDFRRRLRFLKGST